MAHRNDGVAVPARPDDALADDARVLDGGAALGALRRRWWVLLSVPILFVAVALALSARQSESYASTALLLFSGPSSASGAGQPDIADEPDRYLQTQAEILRGPGVRDEVRRAVAFEPHYTVDALFSTDILEVRARAGSPDDAAAVANAAVAAYLDLRASQAQAELQTATAELETRIAALDAEIAVVDQRLAAGAPQAAAQSLAQQRTSLIDDRSEVRSQLDQWTIGTTLASGTARLLTAATADGQQVAPRPVRSAALAGVVGLLLGLLGVVVLDRSPHRVRNVADLARSVPNLPVLGEVGRPPALAPRGMHGGATTGVEQFRCLRVALAEPATGLPPRRIQITGSRAGLNTSLLALNLASAFADAGLRAMVVECDLRRPGLSRVLGTPDDVGVTDVLSGKVPLSEAVVASDRRSLAALTAGHTVDDAGRLVDGPGIRWLLTRLVGGCEVLIVNTPPAVQFADAAVISSLVDATVVIASPGARGAQEVRAALSQLGDVATRVVGLVLAHTLDGTVGAADTLTASRPASTTPETPPPGADRKAGGGGRGNGVVTHVAESTPVHPLPRSE